MRVIAEFVDSRNGNRYLPGDGNKINPALTADQVQRLTKAQCLKEGDEAPEPEKAPVPGADKQDEPLDLSKKTRGDLEALAATRNVDISDCTNKQQIIDKLAGV